MSQDVRSRGVIPLSPFWRRMSIISLIIALLLLISASIVGHFLSGPPACGFATPLVGPGTPIPTPITSINDGVTLYVNPGLDPSGGCVTFPPGPGGSEVTYELTSYNLEGKVSSVGIPLHPRCPKIGRFHLRLYRIDKAQIEFDQTSVQITAEYDNAGDTITVKMNDCPAKSNAAFITNEMPGINNTAVSNNSSMNNRGNFITSVAKFGGAFP